MALSLLCDFVVNTRYVLTTRVCVCVCVYVYMLGG